MLNKDFDRRTEIELLRIISMLMIVFHHFAVHGGFEWQAYDMTLSHLWYIFIDMGGKVGVDIFVLISGYFLISSKDTFFNFKRVLKFWGQVFFYSIVIYLIFVAFGVEDFGIKRLIKSLFPITFSIWWFASAYFVLYLIHPFLNMFLTGLDRKSYQSLLVLLVIMWSIIPTFTSSQFEGSTLSWFVTLYAIAGYAKLYGFNQKLTSKHYFVLWLCFSILTYITSVIFAFKGKTYLYRPEKLSVLLISITLFMAFVTFKMNYNKWINNIATATFGVYLLHDNEFVRRFLWLDLFKNAQCQNSWIIIPYSIGVVLMVYAACTIIDLARKYLLEKPYMRFVNKYSDILVHFFNRICAFFKKIVFG